MHRFRKKSETRRSANPEALRPIDSDHTVPFPSLLPASDFRTSLILPGLARRFTLLRSEDGVPVGLEHLRARFAEQRARGAPNQVSEEEETMILEALGRMRVRTAAAEQQDDLLSDPGISPRQSSTNSLDTSTSSLMGNVVGYNSPTPTSKDPRRSQKRHSNNLFGSGKFRDDVYIRTVRGNSGRSALSNTGSDTSTISRSLQTNTNFLRPGSPDEADSSGISAPSSPNVLTDRESLSTSQSAFLNSSPNTSTEIRLSDTFHPDLLKRASIVLEEVIREIEEEAEEPGVDDDIVLLRSPGADQRQKTVNDEPNPEQGDEEVFTVTALSRDEEVMDQSSAQSSALMYGASRGMSPTPRVPGYIPGMQRPMTPHDILEPEEQISATPRARSPRLPLSGSYNSAMNATNSSLGRRDSNASTAKQPSRTGTPLSTNPGGFLSRSLNGRYTPTEERLGSDPFDSDRNSSKRRPASPLSTTSFQAMMAHPNESPFTSSRPNTPSSAAMLQSQPSQQQSVTSTPSFRPTHIRHESGHSRNGSISSLTEVLHKPNFNPTPTTTTTASPSIKPEANKTITRNVRSPVLPDSPYIETGRSSAQGYSTGDKVRVGDHERAPSVISGMDLGSPFSFSRMLRSPTPNGNIPPTTTTTGAGNPQESVGKRAKSPSFSIDQPNITSTSTTTTRMGKHQKHESGSSFVLSLGPSTQPLVLTPFLNSSRSSFGSEGSSYHSTDEENGKKDRVKALFAKIEGEPPEWHDFTDTNIDNLGVPSGLEVSFRSLLKEEELVKQLSGLNRDDFVAIQEKLVDVAQSRVDKGDRDKAGSVMKKRRPSTSQSFYTNGATTNGRVGSPQPVNMRSASPSAANVLSSVSAAGPTIITNTVTTIVETQSQPPQVQTQNAKANALLDSVLDSIESPRVAPALLTPQSSVQSQRQDTPESPAVPEGLDSPTRRNRDLADALFGPQDSVDIPPITVLQIPTTSPLNISRSVSNDGTVTSSASTPHLLRTPETPSTRLFMGRLSSPNLTIPDDDELAKQVLAKVEAATMALQKSPSNPKFPDGVGPPIPTAKRKVDRDQISSPKLVSASMSVDTIALKPTTPIDSPNSGSGANLSGTLKLGQRFRKLRGTLRGKPLPSGEEVHPYPVDLAPSKSISPATSPNLIHSPLVHPGDASISSAEHSGSMSITSAVTVTVEPQVSLTPAPSSSGSSFKGFMARFRKNKEKEKGGDNNLLTTKSGSSSIRSAGSPGTTTSPLHASSSNSPPQSQSAPPTRLSFSGRRPNSIQMKKRSEDLSQTLAGVSANNATTSGQELEEDENQVALKQLWDAASHLKLDSAALNNLVARSPSNVSKSSTWSKAIGRASLVPGRKSKPIDPLPEEGPHSSRPSLSEGRSSLEGLQRVSSKVAGPVIRKLSIKKHSNSTRRKEEAPVQQTGTPALRPQRSKQGTPQPQTYGHQTPPQPEEKQNPRNTILRRTIIVPSDTKGLPPEIQTLLRKGSTKRRRSASAASTHSIQDRAPTPPPPKNGPGVSGKRFSTDVSANPMPGSSSNNSNLEVPGIHEKVNSAYDSLYEMYAEDSRAPSVAHQRDDADGAHPLESGPAIEVIELANGETIWSIVNGLRGDDSESFYGDRASFASEYSLRDGPNDGVQLHFKEHGRSGSKGSMSSFVSSKKQGMVGRPETKVFLSSSAQIGRLIENLSKGVDSGSFNILPHRHSHATSQSFGSSSEAQWTVEERLEQLLGSMN